MLFDNSFRGSKYKSENKNFDYKKQLLEDKKIDRQFMNRLKLLTLEEIVYLKLDASFVSLKGKLMGFPLFKIIPDICREALLLFALSSTNNKRDAANIMGINKHKLNYLIKRHNINFSKGIRKNEQQ
tara:strand:+ start:1907 stop:2287 length:381 start_codon:yes stop_codon:yes gene_type:complete